MSRQRDVACVELMTAPVVEVIACEEVAAPVAACAVRGPFQHVRQGLLVAGRGGAEDIHRSGELWLAELISWKSDMSVFQLLHCDDRSGGDLESRPCRCLILHTLVGVAEEVRAIDASAPGDCGREEVVVGAAVEASISARDVATRISHRASVVTIAADHCKLFIPGMCGGQVREDGESSEQRKHADGRFAHIESMWLCR